MTGHSFIPQEKLRDLLACHAPIADVLVAEAEERFTDQEITRLEELVPNYFEKLRRAPSPRAIRSLLFKTQLFRLLAELRVPGQPPFYLFRIRCDWSDNEPMIGDATNCTTKAGAGI